MEQEDHGCCASCHLVLKQPFVECKTISCSSPKICLECFSKGREFDKHKNNHRYTIVQEDFSVLSPTWSASEEVQLLDSLITRGEGNWEEISKNIPSKSPEECRSHYEKFYLDVTYKNSSINATGVCRQDQPVIFVASEVDPLRPQTRSNLHKDLAGYNAARGDFDWESDNLAEMELNSIEANDSLYEHILDHHSKKENEDDDDESILIAALSGAALQIYNQRLKKRLKRKKVVREFGLLNKSRSLAFPKRYPLIWTNKFDHIFKLGRLMCAFDLDFVSEGLEHEFELRQQILRLQDNRSNGLTHSLAAAFYTKMKAQREQELIDKPKETILDYIRSAKTKLSHLRANPLMTMTTRRGAGPLDIVGLPSYEKLNEDERDLCSECRVFPEVFLDIKKILVEECGKSNGLRLADARPLVKIDVNKTRKLYDFLLKKALIYAPPTPISKK